MTERIRSPTEGEVKRMLASIFLMVVCTLLGNSRAAEAQTSRYNWSGVYLGGALGGGWGEGDVDLSPGGFPNRESFDIDGTIFGGFAGVQYHWDNWVLGLEVSYSEGDIEGTTVDTTFPAAIFLAGMDELWTVCGRLGYAWDRWLFYGTGGYAQAQVNAGQRHVTGGIPGFAIGETKEHDGWVVGAGLEYAVTDHVILGVEYLHVDLESSLHSGIQTFILPTDIRHNVDADLDVVQARLIFKFGREEFDRPK